jgi:cell division protein FtsB
VCIAAAVACALLVAGVLDRDSGIGQWSDLRRDLDAARGRIAALRAEISSREREARALEADPLAIEGAIRSDLGLARPGEWVARDEDLTSLRNP